MDGLTQFQLILPLKIINHQKNKAASEFRLEFDVMISLAAVVVTDGDR